jgi:hypothetical protein
MLFCSAPYHLEMLLGKIPGTTHMIRYENTASQRKFFAHELEPSFSIKKLPFSPAQYTQHTSVFHATNWSTA